MTFQILSGAESLIKVKYTDICSSGHLNPLKTVFHQISGRLVFLKSLGKKKYWNLVPISPLQSTRFVCHW